MMIQCILPKRWNRFLRWVRRGRRRTGRQSQIMPGVASMRFILAGSTLLLLMVCIALLGNGASEKEGLLEKTAGSGVKLIKQAGNSIMRAGEDYYQISLQEPKWRIDSICLSIPFIRWNRTTYALPPTSILPWQWATPLSARTKGSLTQLAAEWACSGHIFE